MGEVCRCTNLHPMFCWVVWYRRLQFNCKQASYDSTKLEIRISAFYGNVTIRHVIFLISTALSSSWLQLCCIFTISTASIAFERFRLFWDTISKLGILFYYNSICNEQCREWGSNVSIKKQDISKWVQDDSQLAWWEYFHPKSKEDTQTQYLLPTIFVQDLWISHCNESYLEKRGSWLILRV